MTLILLGINLLLVMLVWHFMVKKTALDHTRDKLFDLRDEIRKQFLDKGWDMNSELYRNLRNQINAYLFHTEQFSIWFVLSLGKRLARQPEIQKFSSTRTEVRYQTINAEQREFVLSIRGRASDYIAEFSTMSNGLLLLLSLIMLPTFALTDLLAFIRDGLGVGRNVGNLLGVLRQGLSQVWKQSAHKVAAWLLINPEFLDVAVSAERRLCRPT